jgi:hypothetical protein
MAAFGFALVVAVRWLRRFSSALSLGCLSCLWLLLRLLSLFKLNVDLARSRVWPGRSMAADMTLLSKEAGNYETGWLAAQSVGPAAIEIEVESWLRDGPSVPWWTGDGASCLE